MVQDFAKKKTAAEPRQAAPQAAPNTAPSWSLMLTGLVTGMALGVFISFLAYISGVVPPMPGQQERMAAQASQADSDAAAAQAQLNEELERAAQRLQLEFYQELPNYELVVDATPLDIPGSDRRTRPPEPESTDTSEAAAATTQQSPPPGSNSYMLQAGAFQQESTAIAQRDRLRDLGLQTQVRQEALLGRTLFLVQSGPYHGREQLTRAERVLRSNSIESMRITLGNR